MWNQTTRSIIEWRSPSQTSITNSTTHSGHSLFNIQISTMLPKFPDLHTSVSCLINRLVCPLSLYLIHMNKKDIFFGYYPSRRSSGWWYSNYADDTAMFYGRKPYNDVLMQAGPKGNVQSDLTLEKDGNKLTLRKGWAFPRRVYFNGNNCVMPSPES